MVTTADAALHALFAGMDALAPMPEDFSGRVVFLRAQGGAILSDYPNAKQWMFEQSFAPHALRLKDSGYPVLPEVDAAPGSADYVLYLATRFAEENEATLARAWNMLKPGGWLIAALHNDLGSKRLSGLMKQLPVDDVASSSKYHCRAVAARKPDDYRETPEAKKLLTAWLEGAKAKPVAGTPLHAAPGMFSWRGIDAGSALLVGTLPKSLSGKGADVACGWGYLSWAVLSRSPNITQLTLIEAEKRALDLAERYAKPEGCNAALNFHWADATRPLPVSGLDFIIMNPPAHDLMHSAADATAAIFARAAAALRSGGVLWLVANSHLPYERTLESLFTSVRPAVDDGGFKVLECLK